MTNFSTLVDFTFDSQDELHKSSRELEALRKELKVICGKVEDLERIFFQFYDLQHLVSS